MVLSNSNIRKKKTPPINLHELINLIKYPLLTEKATNLYEDRQYTFIVDRSLTKTQIKYVLENIFQVNILDISTLRLPPKTRRVGKFIGKRTNYKKAVIKLKQGDTIAELFN
jgi:large subunit ribosomal protein L23